MTDTEAVIPAGGLLPTQLRLPAEPIYTTIRDELLRQERITADTIPPWPEAEQ